MSETDALDLIDRITMDDFCMDAECELAFHPENLSPREKIAIEKLLRVYTIAHSMSRTHTCYGSHEAWRKEAEEKFAAIKSEDSVV